MLMARERKERASTSVGILVLFLFSMIGVPAAPQDFKTRDEGPRQLIITYHCSPAARAAFRDYMLKEGLARFEGWKKQGIFQDYKVLLDWFVDAETWDMLVILSFKDYGDVDKWRAIERSSPGGLGAEGLAFGSPAISYAMDLFFQGTSTTRKTDSAKSVFLTIPYVYYPATSLDEYAKHVAGYVTPQFDRWIKDDVLVSYQIYINRFQTGRNWQALFLLEYKDTVAFGQREREVDKVKAELVTDANWKALGDRKLKIRTEMQTTTSELLALPH